MCDSRTRTAMSNARKKEVDKKTERTPILYVVNSLKLLIQSNALLKKKEDDDSWKGGDYERMRHRREVKKGE
jgi:hypothetical protein